MTEQTAVSLLLWGESPSLLMNISQYCLLRAESLCLTAPRSSKTFSVELVTLPGRGQEALHDDGASLLQATQNANSVQIIPDLNWKCSPLDPRPTSFRFLKIIKF